MGVVEDDAIPHAPNDVGMGIGVAWEREAECR